MKPVDIVNGVIKGAVRVAFRLFDDGTSPGVPQPGSGRGQDPVVLVNGFSVHGDALAPLARALTRDGFRVFVVDLPNRAMGDIDATARFLGDYVRKVRSITGAQRVDLVGYSEGGLVNRAFVKWHGGDHVVDSVVALGTPHTGVLFAGLSAAVEAVGLLRALVPEAARQMIAGSAFIKRLNSRDMTPGEHVRYTSIYSERTDGIVWPAGSGALEGARNIALHRERWAPFMRGPHHLRLPNSDEAYAAIRGALLARG